MGTPNISDNYAGYEEGELIRRVANLKDKSLYLVHGTADDNVHLQHSLQLARALSAAGVIYQHQVSSLTINNNILHKLCFRQLDSCEKYRDCHDK